MVALRPLCHLGQGLDESLGMAFSFSRLLLLSTLLYHLVEAQFNLFPNDTHSTGSLSQDCITTLNATIACNPYTYPGHRFERLLW